MRAHPLLERDEPRARLEAALDAARRRSGRILSLEGEAGIGKSSLALDFVEAHRADARVYVGGCENLSTPEPLGPLRDIVRESRGRFVMPSGGRLATYESLLRLLTGGAQPALLVLEDLHWADEATLDMLRFLARRIRGEPVLVVVTFRNEEPDSRHRLAALWADLPRDGCERVELKPLSAEAVATLAGAAGRMGREVFDATAGNPFHVTEYLATAPEVPASVQAATLARAADLTPHGRRTLDFAALFPRQIHEAILVELAGDHEHAGVEECLRLGMLQAHGERLAFRHELARRAVYEAMSPLRRRAMHAQALALVTGRGSSAAEAAHHAEQAGAVDEVIRYSLDAADEARKLGAHRQTMAHIETALRHGGELPMATTARLLEALAEAGELCGEPEAALDAIDRAIASHRQTGDRLGLGNALRIAARIWWTEGHSAHAEECSQEALEVLAPHPDSWQYAMALSGQAQLDALADRHALAVPRGREAMRLAEALGRTDIYMHARTNVSIALTAADPDAGFPEMEASIEEGLKRHAHDSLPRLYGSWTYMLAHNRRYEHLFERIEDGVRIATARDHVPMVAYIRSMRATALLDLGQLEAAVAEGEHVAYGPYPKNIMRFPALVALSRGRVRLGRPEDGALDLARNMPTAKRDIMRLAYIAVADAEAAWLGHDRGDVVGALRRAIEQILGADSQPWTLAETALWLAILGEPTGLSGDRLAGLGEPFRLHIAGDWRGAAEAWRRLGAPFEEAVALSGGDEAAQRAAVALFDRLGAAPAANILRRRLRQQGVRAVPSGPRQARRDDPLGLTPRQNQVLALLAEGLSNGEIADRLTTSPKTVEHHVGAILAALEAPSRLRAVQIARERGILAD